MAKFWGMTMEMQASNHQTPKDRPVNHIRRDHTVKFWEVPVITDQTIMIIISFLGETRTIAVTREEIQLQVLVNTPIDNSSKIIMLIILVQILGIVGTSQEDQDSPTLGLMRYNQQYSPIYPPTPSLNSSFPEALSKSLLQIVENQSRTIEAMKASQEAQAEAYKEMSRTNKMRDDDALFNSIEAYDRSNPTQFEKWIDSINQATHITGRDLRKELLKKSDGVIRNLLTIIDAAWSDNDIIAKLHQDFSSSSTMNKAREELKSLYQEPGEPITVFIYKYSHMPFHRYQGRKGNSPICYYRVHFSIGTSAQQGCSEEIHRCQEQAPYLGGSLPVGRTVLQKDAGGQFAGSYLFIVSAVHSE